MITSQNQTLLTTSAGSNQDSLPRTWKNWKHEHPEFDRGMPSIVAFEGKILIVGGHLESEDKRTTNLILIDPENQKFQIIQPTGVDAQFDCNSKMAACYWKDSKVVVFGGYDYYGRSMYSSAVGVITFKDLDSENPSAHWEKIVTLTELFRVEHSAHIHEDKMYVFGGYDENEQKIYDIWCLDLTSFAWDELPFTCINDPRGNYCIVEGPVVFHENKAYTFFWESHAILEIDLKVRSSEFIFLPPTKLHHLCTELCLQLVDEKIFFVTHPMNQQYDKSVPFQIWAADLNLRDWVEIKTTEPVPNFTGSLLYCNNHLVYYGTCEEGTDPFFCQVWSLPLNVPKTASTAVLSKIQQALKDFFFEAPYSDISFEVESQIIKAHKWWLAQRNKFFANMFTSGMAEAQASQIKIIDMKAPTFKGLLEFLYSDHVELDNSLALDLLKQADKYSVGELKNACEKHLVSNIEPENYVALGQIAELIGAVALRDAVVVFIAKNMKIIKQRKDFNDISDALLRDSLVKFIVK